MQYTYNEINSPESLEAETLENQSKIYYFTVPLGLLYISTASLSPSHTHTHTLSEGVCVCVCVCVCVFPLGPGCRLCSPESRESTHTHQQTSQAHTPARHIDLCGV